MRAFAYQSVNWKITGLNPARCWAYFSFYTLLSMSLYRSLEVVLRYSFTLENEWLAEQFGINLRFIINQRGCADPFITSQFEHQKPFHLKLIISLSLPRNKKNNDEANLRRIKRNCWTKKKLPIRDFLGPATGFKRSGLDWWCKIDSGDSNQDQGPVLHNNAEM